MLINIICFFLVTAGSLLLYLSAKNQSVLKNSLPKNPWRWVGWLCQALALAGWLSTLGTATAIFVWLSFFMLLIGTLPFLPLYGLVKGSLVKDDLIKEGLTKDGTSEDSLSKERLVKAK